MTKPVVLGVIAALACSAAASAQTPPAAPMAKPAAAAPAAAFSVKSTVGDLLDNPDTKAVLLKHVPEVVNNPQIEQGRPFPLEGIAPYAPQLTPEMLAKIDADLAKVPAPKK